ncbi:MAG: WXG100 family type VII secretion target, partial [Anaerolineae bacterium]
MGASFIQVNYDTLENVAKRFGEEAGAIDETHRRLETVLRLLRNGGWEGKGSSAFFQEMEVDVFPALVRLVGALE